MNVPEAFLGMNSTTILAGEPAWSADVVGAIIDELSSQGFAVVGVELWQAVGQSPKWVASSDYQCAEDAGMAQQIACCASAAKAFVDRWRQTPEALFNLTWIALTEHTPAE